MNLKIIFISLSMLATTMGLSQNNKSSIDSFPAEQTTQIEYRHTIGASFFMLGNIISDDSPDYYLLTYGYRLTQKDRVFIEFNTWKYSEPLGTYGHSTEYYPGFVRAYGIGIGYQRFHWKGLTTTIEATPFMKQYHDMNDNKIQKGFQLYVQLIAGYRFEFFKKRFYVEPAYALKYWPIDTNYPSDFAKIEVGKPMYIFEPSLNFGFKF